MQGATVIVTLLAAIVGAVSVVVYRALRSRRAIQRVLHTEVDASMARNLVPELGGSYELISSRHGPMLVNSNDAYLGQAIIRYGECCELEVQFLLQLLAVRPGWVVEVGANIGTHTVPVARALAALGRRMIVFEPQPYIFQNLCANLALNSLSNVSAWPFACGDRTGTVYFSPPDYATDGNFGGISMGFDATGLAVEVPCHRLDELVKGRPVSMLKVDVEGFELLVLQGAVETLEGSRPVLYVENDRVDRSKELIEWLWSKQYRLWWHIPPLFNPNNFFHNDEDRYKGVASFNMLGLPRELDLPVKGLPEILVNTHPLEQNRH